MGYFRNWSDWVTLRESNARKRNVKAALNGQSPPLPGSYAACPSTNPQAMDTAQKKGVVSKNTAFKFKESFGQRPDYSFDRWIQKAKEFGDDVNTMVTHGHDEEDKIDKEDKKQKDDAEKADAKPKPESEPKKPEPKRPADEDDEDGKKDKDEILNRLRELAKKKSPPTKPDDKIKSKK